MTDALELFKTSIELFGAAAGFVVLYAAFRVTSRLSFSLQQRALRFLFLAVLFFVLSQFLKGIDGLLLEYLPFEVLLEAIQEIAALLVVICVGVAVYLLYKSEHSEVAALRRTANVDALTALHNQAFFRRAASRRVALAREHDLPLACVMLDIDDFKEYNDLYGHEAGNVVLRCVARVLRESARADDLVARYGGEEFMLVMNNSLEEASEVAERIRFEIEHRCSPGQDDSLSRQVTVSAGVSTLAAQTRTLEDLIDAADDEMYRAKRSGKNRVSHT